MQTNSEARRVGIWTITILIIAAALYGVVKFVPSGSDIDGGNGKSVAEVTAEDHTKGEGTVTLIEYSDFQCPACKNYYPIIKQVTAELGAQATVVYRHFPLTTIHQNARAAAEASEAAAKQGKFWEMHDRLFEGQESWAEDRNPQLAFEQYAKDLGLNIEQFNRDREAAEIRQRVERDIQDGNSANINSTPTFYLNGKKMDSPRTYADFKSAIEQAIVPVP
jgi:protein-disulfide isomerase